MNEYMVYFFDNTYVGKYSHVEKMVVEGNTKDEALVAFHKATQSECSVRSIDLLSAEK